MFKIKNYVLKVILISFFIIISSCHQSSESPVQKNEVLAPQIIHEANSLQEIIGYVLKCDTSKGPAFVYAFSPHIFGIWDSVEEKTLEYFFSQFITKNGELVFESGMTGALNMRLTTKKFGEPKNHRFLIKFQKGKVHFLVANGIDKDKKPINPMEYICVREDTIAHNFSQKK